MTIEPGYYKIRLGGGKFGSHHYLRVTNQKGQLHLQQDHGSPEPMQSEIQLGHITILKKINNEEQLAVMNMRVTVDFVDEEGYNYSLIARNMYSLKRIFEQFPHVKRQFIIK